MRKPIAPIVRLRLASRFARNGHDAAAAVEMANQALAFIESAGLELVVPGWVPVIDEEVVLKKRVFAWEDIPAMVEEMEERAPWMPYEKRT